MQLTRPRILYAEDHQDTRELVSLMLRHSNYEVIGTESGAAALDQARRERFDLYLFDTILPDVSGIELCHKIREFDASTPILFFSGVAHEAAKLKALSCGAQGYLTKPGEINELTDTVSRLIRSSQSTGAPPPQSQN
jgi:DNA-binding response OmpR family regulator